VRCFVLRIITCLILLSNPNSSLLLTFKSFRCFYINKHTNSARKCKKDYTTPNFCDVLDVCNSPTFRLISLMNLLLATH